MNLGKNIQFRCKERGWSLSVLAKRSSVPKATLHGWTTGRQVSNLTQLRRVSQALEMSLFELVFGISDPYAHRKNAVREVFKGDLRVTIHEIS